MVPSTLISTTAAVLKDTFSLCMFIYEYVGQIPLQTAWGPRAFVSTVWDTAATLSLRKKVNIPFQEAELQAIPHQNNSLIFVLKTVSVAIIWISPGPKMSWPWFRKACPQVCLCHGLPTFSAACSSLLTWTESMGIWVSSKSGQLDHLDNFPHR